MNEQGDHASYRVLIFGRDGMEVLLTHSHSCLQLPAVTIPQWERVAENVTGALQRQWGAVVACMFEPDSQPTGPSRYIVARHWRTCGASADLCSIPVSELSANCFSDPDDYRVMHESLAKCKAPDSEAGKLRFARLRWFEELCGWVGEAVGSRGLHLTADFRQLNASSTFSLVRFETNGPAMWFKAVGEPNEREFPITLNLARTFPSFLPDCIAARSDWKAWLACEAEGTNLAETSDLTLWESAARSLARLQIESIDKCGVLLESGAHHLSAANLVETVNPFLEVIAGLMSQQTKTPPCTISDKELDVLGQQIRDAISTLTHIEIPDTLGHLDLNPANLIVPALNPCVFLDWAEAYVGHPFYSFQYLLEHLRRMAGADPVAEHTFTSSYLRPWSDIASAHSLTEAMALAPLVAAFAYGAGTNAWRTPERLRDPKFTGYLRALARRMKREADQLSEGSAPCIC